MFSLPSSGRCSDMHNRVDFARLRVKRRSLRAAMACGVPGAAKSGASLGALARGDTMLVVKDSLLQELVHEQLGSVALSGTTYSSTSVTLASPPSPGHS